MGLRTFVGIWVTAAGASLVWTAHKFMQMGVSFIDRGTLLTEADQLTDSQLEEFTT